MTDITLADDLMHGVGEIAAFIGKNERQTYYACEQKQIPAFKIGQKWCARKSTLLAHIARLEQGEAAQ